MLKHIQKKKILEDDQKWKKGLKNGGDVGMTEGETEAGRRPSGNNMLKWNQKKKSLEDNKKRKTSLKNSGDAAITEGETEARAEPPANMLKRIQKKKILEDNQKRKISLNNAGDVAITEGETEVRTRPPDTEEDSPIDVNLGKPGLLDEQQTDDSQEVEENLHIHGTQTIRRTRGPTRLPNIWNRLPGQQLPDQFNMYNQCVDDGTLSRFCGTIARDPKITPLEYDDWRKVPESDKEQIWRIVKSKYNLRASRRTWVLKEVGRLLRNFKTTLYSDNFYKYNTLAELKRNKDPRTRQDQWEALVSKWYSSKWQEKSEHGRKARKEMKLPHTSGTISFARRAEQELKNTGKRPNRAKLFSDWHKARDGKAVTVEAQVALDKIQDILQDGDLIAEVEGSGNDVDAFAPIDEDVLSRVLGPERNGSVRGLGFGVSPKIFNKSHSDIMHENDELRQENLDLKEKYDMLSKKIDTLIQLEEARNGDLNITKESNFRYYQAGSSSQDVHPMSENMEEV